MKSKIYFDKNKFWAYSSNKNALIWIKGFCNFSNIELLNKLEKIDKKELADFIKTITGHFTIVFSSPKRTIIVVDRIRSTPIYYFQKNDKILISPTLNKIKNKFNSTFTLNEQAKLEISMGGFTIGKKSIYYEINSPNAGHYILIENNSIEETSYFNYFGEIDLNSSKSQLIKELTEITLEIFKNTLERVGNRQIVIPLSAGNDSRLVASCLKHLGAQNILCFTYGNKNSFEVKTAKKIAKKLGYNWVFVPLTHGGERKFYRSQMFKDYLDFADSIDSIPYFQGLSSLKYLKEKMLIDEDAVFINGNSGDFISGLHINKLYEFIGNNYLNKNDLIDVLKEKYIEKHFSLWGNLKNEENISLINSSIDKALEQIGEINSVNVHLAYEKLELIDRQSKYVISGQKTYEYFGHDWFLPLWDDKYLNFWRKIPVEFKFQQNLYKEFLFKENFGDVWNLNLPVNKLNIKPTYLIPIRYFFKILFLAFKLKNWNQFETVFIKYWTDPALYYKFKSYYEIIKGYRLKPRNVIAYLANDFVKNLK